MAYFPTAEELAANGYMRKPDTPQPPPLPAQAMPPPGGLDLQYDPPQPPPLPAWKQRDEQELREVRARLAELEARRAHAIAAITRVTDELFLAGVTQGDAVAYMIDNADDIRDALQPFDSGVRAV